MKRFIYKVTGLLALVLLLTQCNKINDYLKREPVGGLSELDVFTRYGETEKFIAGIYAKMAERSEWWPAAESTNKTFSYAAASDEAICSVQYPNGPQIFTQGTFNASNNPLDRWNDFYAGVRKANLFLEKIGMLAPQNSTQASGKQRMIGEAHFLRAFFYMELFKRYGGVPLVDRVLNISDSLNLRRNSAEETVNFIAADCDAAAQLLPVEHSATDWGRATKGAALMLKAKALLFGASLLHNPSQDKAKWLSAADAARAVADLNYYQVDADYAGLMHKRTARNIIFQSNINQTDWVHFNFIPSLGGQARVQPLQNLVDAYDMKSSGLPITEDPSYDAVNNPYANRDPRFYLSIIHDGSAFKGSPVLTYLNAPGGNDEQRWGGERRTQTGFYLRKTVDETGSITPNAIVGDHFWIFMRFEETLLCYAEAMNEYLDAPDQSVYDAVNQVRTRVGMPALPAGLSKEKMRQRIRNERRVELAFEGQRFWDIRRWRIGTEVMLKARGVIIDGSGPAKKHWDNEIETRIYKPAFDLFPIPQSELNKQPALTQNEGY
ncbi:RagB/SusD family nutrient uptake outer membrane protein [Niabella drilacis]|uniref:Starch-binding associating with outer membrane n=1 Tax=Niabella drilacis (strain DSM 25811 / CCM 8410 / CCUG 62505 / LMG 26954 / E90) TaxID=1285928 RepID=A0A1G6MVW1_NIADE|nr:RagB/SusD family nutrient uptake outer membrane protein [Niabella drilacis]SDC59337.1 Starch-binding associating with outer membrane [Niabella drilacis]